MAGLSPASVPGWLRVCRHRVPGVRVPYFLILQHGIVAGPTRIVAPVVPAGAGPAGLLAPRVLIGAAPHRAMLLNMVSVAVGLLGETLADADVAEQAVTDALDAIFRGYPVGIPLP